MTPDATTEVTLGLLATLTVTAPSASADTSRFVVKLIVPAVPTLVPSSLIRIPVPDAVTPVKPEPSQLQFQWY